MEEEKLFEEMNDFVSEADLSSGSDDDGLPFEPTDAFSTDPVSFIEMSERLMAKVENIFDLTRIYNRHSAKYLKACALLEKGIKRLGSVCVTKRALEENNSAVFAELKQLTTQKLYRMASFNYRKLDTALTEKLEKGNDLYPELTEMGFRYFHLLQRLRATERNIYFYFYRRYSASPNLHPLIEGHAFSERSWTGDFAPDKEEAPVFRAAPAFPVLKEELKAETVFSEAPAAAAPRLSSPADGKGQPEASAGQASDAGSRMRKTSGTKPEGQEDPEEIIPLRTEPPAWLETVRNMVSRIDSSKDGSIDLTDEEIRELQEIPDFELIFPNLSKAVKSAAGRIRGGT